MKKRIRCCIVFFCVLLVLPSISAQDAIAAPLGKPDTLNQTTIALYWFGGEHVCSNCTAGTAMPHYACSNDPDNWDGGMNYFTDPLKPHEMLSQVTATLHGRFACNSNKNTVILFMEDAVVSFGDLPRLGEGDCKCGNCAFRYEMPMKEYRASDYKYGNKNKIKIVRMKNDSSICLSFIELTLYYHDFHVAVDDIWPRRGPPAGGTNVTVLGRDFFWNGYVGCKFGEHVVTGVFVNESTIVCVSPADKEGQVPVEVSFDGFTWTHDNVTFFYEDSKPTNAPMQWIVLAASFGLLISCGIFAVFLKKIKTSKNLSNPNYTSLLGAEGGFKPVDTEEVELLERIGRGNYGEVYRAVWRNTVVAIKKAKFDSDSEKYEEFLNDLMKEAEIMRCLRHPNVLQFLGFCNNPPEVGLITEYMPQGSLYALLHNNKIDIKWKKIIEICVDVARGMNYLHKSEPIIIHRDLKSHNLLVNEHWTVKVCDFGLSKIFPAQPLSQAMTACGTPCWTAPEVLRNESYTEKADVYSMGIVLWELATRQDPYAGMPPFQVVFAVGHQGIRPPVPTSCPSSLSSLMVDCWAENPDDRPSFDEITNELLNIDLNQKEEAVNFL